jgi:hypothetical protein
MGAKLHLDLRSLSAVRKIRDGADRANLAIEFGLSMQTLEDITYSYDGVSDSLLAAIERLLMDRDKLRRLISRSL